MKRLVAALALLFVLGCGAQPAAAPQAAPASTALPASTTERKIIYRANLDLVVEDLTGLPARVEEAAEQFGGFVASSDLTGSPRAPRRGNWTLRVPAERYSACMAALQELGEVFRVHSDSQDVTEEFYDVEARLRNKKLEEQRLLTLLSEGTGKLEEVLAVEKELSRVRGEAEQIEGRVRVLKDLVGLATIVLSIQEIKGYLPEQAPTYLTRVRRTLQLSLMQLRTAAEGLSIALIAAAPWIVAMGLPLVALVLLIKRRRRRRLVMATAVAERGDG